jgi:purine-binding chemotaxis protein CheW
VVPVVDLALKFGKPEQANTKRTCVLVVETRTKDEVVTLGVVADAVSEVVDLGPEDIEPAPSFGTGMKLEHITGMGKAGRGFVILLDIDRVLMSSEAELASVATALAQVEARGAEKAPRA